MKEKSLAYIALLFVLLSALWIFGSFLNASPSGFETVSVGKAREMVENEDVFLLDVRTPAEFNESHIEEATLIPLVNGYGSNLGQEQLLESRIDEVPEGKKVLVYCRTGSRSAVASQMLVDAGYTDVYNMEGGITEWVGAGYSVVTGS